MAPFFRPTPQFLEWAGQALKRPLFDVGAGTGNTTAALLACSIPTIAIELFPHDHALVPVIPLDGRYFAYPKGATILLCRPCHGDFVEDVIRQAKKCRCTVVYVGLVKNISKDIGESRGDFQKVFMEAGAEGERVWIMRDEDDGKVATDTATTMRWTLVRLKEWTAPSWMKDKGERWGNLSGGYCTKRDTDTVIESVTLEIDADLRDLDWTKTGMYKTEGDYGWLSPEGTMYFCDWMGHSNVAHYIIKKEVAELEATGWARIDGPGEKKKLTYRHNGKLTEAQREWLVARGHDLDPYGWGEEANVLVDEKADMEAYERYMKAAPPPSKRKKR